MRKLLLIGALITVTAVSSQAQDFTLKHDTMTATTEGVLPPQDWNDDAIALHNYLRNETSAPITFQWQIHEKSLPSGWSLFGFCDNLNCRPEDHPALTFNQAETSKNIPVGDSSLLEPRFAIPRDAANGVGILRVHVWRGTLHDTATYIVTKTEATGISVINIGDKRVNISPNPASKNVQVYTEKSLNVNKITVFNLLGRRELAIDVKTGTEISDVNINTLANGMYLIHLTDANGKLVTSRKFVKN